FKYGLTCPWVMGLMVVLVCGCVLDLRRGEVFVHECDGFEVECLYGWANVMLGMYRMPAVPKCSAGYFAAFGMDLIDLFIGVEGMFGVIVDASLRVLPSPPSVMFALIPVPNKSRALLLVDELQRASIAT